MSDMNQIDSVIEVADMNEANQIVKARQSVNEATLLQTYCEMFNEKLNADGMTSTATFQDVADALDMTVENVYQRILKIRKEKFAPQGLELPLMKRSNAPRKNRVRNTPEALLDMVAGFNFIKPKA